MPQSIIGLYSRESHAQHLGWTVVYVPHSLAAMHVYGITYYVRQPQLFRVVKGQGFRCMVDGVGGCTCRENNPGRQFRVPDLAEAPWLPRCARGVCCRARLQSLQRREAPECSLDILHNHPPLPGVMDSVWSYMAGDTIYLYGR